MVLCQEATEQALTAMVRAQEDPLEKEQETRAAREKEPRREKAAADVKEEDPEAGTALRKGSMR